MSSDVDSILNAFAESAVLHQQVAPQLTEPITRAVETIWRSLERGGKVLVFGNGGSAADSQHFAAELVGRFVRERKALAAMALTTDTSIVTSVANDYSFDRIFVRQIDALGTPNDVAFGISTSGQSANVVAGLKAAKTNGLTTIAMTGADGGAAGKVAEIHLNVPSSSTARVQEVHRTVLHVICELIEARIE